MKLLTVAVPCYNSQDYMEKCLTSLLAGGERVEVLIVDDGSTDKTAEIADAWEARYPLVFKAIHQENGGHGEGINQGIRHATGLYFKIVDSDDWLSEDLPRFLDCLEACEKQGGADLVVTNYIYDHMDPKQDRVINFSNALPEGRIFGWEETRPFRTDQVMMIHTCTFRTAHLRARGLEMPKHLFYEDNLFVYGNLPGADRMYYFNSDLYHYFIGREGQSVQKEQVTKRYQHQVKASELLFTSCHLDEIKSKRQQRYMKHEAFIIFGIAILVARLNETDQAERDLDEMWANCRAYDAGWADYFRKKTLLRFLCIKGKFGVGLVKFIYNLSHRIVRFN